MRTDLTLRRKLTLRAHGQQVVFVKKRQEGLEHVLMKAFVWALYLPAFPNMFVELSIGDRYKPDLVALNALGEPLFWGEAGKVSRDKISSLARRYRDTHFALAKWATRLTPYVEIVQDALTGLNRSAPFDLIAVPADSAERFIDERGQIYLTPNDVERVRL
jgi:hypothetical protein